jgi:hypothetical protein
MFHLIAVPAGPMLPPLLCLIESRLLERLPGQISTLPHKSLFLAQVMTVVMVVKPLTLLNGCPRTKLLMKLAQSIELEVTITERLALLNSSVKTVCQESHALLKTTTRFIKLKNTVTLRVKPP